MEQGNRPLAFRYLDQKHAKQITDFMLALGYVLKPEKRDTEESDNDKR